MRLGGLLEYWIVGVKKLDRSNIPSLRPAASPPTGGRSKTPVRIFHQPCAGNFET
ncbi:hypothetical protein H8E88_18000 [candidate division KSB1 bacterium]|nr:hypothetical protein [candidate division KSB1 bacterium]